MPNTLDTFIDRLLVCTNIKANLMDFDASELANCVIRSCEQMLCILGSKDHYAHDYLTTTLEYQAHALLLSQVSRLTRV